MKIEVSTARIQAAAGAGLELLSDSELRVPRRLEKSGLLSLLESMLSALASGEVVLTNLPSPETAVPEGEDPNE